MVIIAFHLDEVRKETLRILRKSLEKTSNTNTKILFHV